MPDIQDAISMIEAGDPGQAAELLEKLAAQMPGYATARVLLARSYERLNDWQPALRAWREAHQIIPNSPVVRRGLERAARKASSRSPIESSPAAETAHDSAPPPAEAHPEEEPQEPATDAPAPVPNWRQGARADTAEPAESTEPAESEDTAEPEDAAEPSGSAELADTSEPTDTAEPAGTAESAEAADESDPAVPGETTGPEETASSARDAAGHAYADLDRLISELESARIVPRPDLDEVPPPDLEDDIEDVVSETLARIYASQGQYDEAAHVYELLAEQLPEKADEFTDKASEMRAKASEQE